MPGVTQIRSTTSRGSAEAALSFDWGEDMVSATLATQAALATIVPDLPPGVRFTVRRSRPDDLPGAGAGADVRRRRIRSRCGNSPNSSCARSCRRCPGVAAVDVLGRRAARGRWSKSIPRGCRRWG